MDYKRIYNFGAGPAVLPLPVLERAKNDIFNFKGSGLGVMEISHRTKLFEDMKDEAEAQFRELYGIPKNFELLFMTGGATNQFSMVPMNLIPAGYTADYILSGVWAEKAYNEGQRFGSCHLAGSSKATEYRTLPSEFSYSERSAYVHFTSNNTIYGTQFPKEPPNAPSPLICDASSDILSRRINFEPYGMIYAGAQKNLGIAGVTIVLIRSDLLDRCPENLPRLMNYRTNFSQRSLDNTIPTFPVYIFREVLRWIAESGGLDEVERQSIRKSKLLYECIDRHEAYVGRAVPEARSRTNVTFTLRDESKLPQFLKEAEAIGLAGLKGHKTAGGLRASLYNGLPVEAVTQLVEFMDDFARR